MDMDYRRFGDTYVLRLDRGEEICEALETLAVKERITLGQVDGLGAVDDLILSVYDNRARRYLTNPFSGPCEITSLVGNITTREGKPHLHLHLSAGDIRGNAVGGHLKRATISVTAEIMVRVLPGRVDRQFDPDLGIDVLAFED